MRTEVNLAEIAARADKATLGPWRLEEHGMADYLTSSTVMAGECEVAVACDSNGIFIAHAREDVPALCAAVRHLEEELAELHKSAGHNKAMYDDAEVEVKRLRASLAKIRKAAGPVIDGDVAESRIRALADALEEK